ncbi:M23 family metallopeptidase [Streptomyces meridianus]|uniref:M23 family metallopeptidase n=1 Tax=Streptomyces meridianus TaxID=2938945 RepID=A0ABT0XD99_9ACTN|nr:M23 family metallopeptidase [Streptomyces meridianus]MCM2580370.1 M23 family metallopeptidase [Streptomyces meridianus]
MTKRAKSSTPTRSVLRRRATVLAAGMGVSVALGTGVALAADSPSTDVFATSTADSLAGAVKDQAEGQQKAAEAKAAAEKRAVEDAKERAAAKAAADRKKREDFKKLQASWVKPVDKYELGSTFGIAGDRWSHNHSGQDLVVPTGTSVKAAHTGTVVEAGWGGAYGNNVVIKHGPNSYTQYGHMSKLNVKVGDKVNTAQEIGKSGSTGNSTGPHLHFETRTQPVYGHATDPVKAMHNHGIKL